MILSLSVPISDFLKINPCLLFHNFLMIISKYGKIKEGYGGKHGQIIIDRNHYRKVYETSLLPTIEEETELEKLEKELEEKGTVDFFEDEAKTKWYKLDKDILISDERTGYVKELSRISPIVRHMVNAPRMKRLYVEKQ